MAATCTYSLTDLLIFLTTGYSINRITWFQWIDPLIAVWPTFCC